MTETSSNSTHLAAPVGVKELAFLLPTVLSALAVTLDVGFFYAVDFSLFTLFGLAEHLAFALLMVPFAVALIFIVAFLWSVRRPPGEGTARGIQLVWWMDRILYLALVAIGLWVVITLGLYSPLGLAIMVGVLWITVASRNRPATIIASGAALFLMAFAVGADTATGMMTNPEREHVLKLDIGDVRGVFLRSGERGVLFFDINSKTPAIIKWDQVKTVTSVAPAQNSWLTMWKMLFRLSK